MHTVHVCISYDMHNFDQLYCYLLQFFTTLIISVVYILVHVATHVPHMYLAHTCNEEVLQTNPIKKSTGQCVKRRRVLSVLFLVFCWEIRLL